MKSALRIALSALAGVVAWFVVATVGDLVLRGVLAGYHDAEHVWVFTPVMLVARLAIGAVSTVASGLVASLSSPVRARSRASVALTIVLLLLFLPQHISLWTRFPIWYHLTFLVTLLIGPWLGARILDRSTGRRSGDDAAVRAEPNPPLNFVKDR